MINHSNTTTEPTPQLYFLDPQKGKTTREANQQHKEISIVVKTKQVSSKKATPTNNQDEPRLISIESRVPLHTLEDSCMTKFAETQVSNDYRRLPSGMQ